jgi:hypothetical protein
VIFLLDDLRVGGLLGEHPLALGVPAHLLAGFDTHAIARSLCRRSGDTPGMPQKITKRSSLAMIISLPQRPDAAQSGHFRQARLCRIRTHEHVEFGTRATFEFR